MAKLTPTGADNFLRKAEAVLSAVGNATAPVSLTGFFNIQIEGVFSGSIGLERSMDGGVVWVQCTRDGAPIAFTAPVAEIGQNYEEDVLFRLRALTLASGTPKARLSK